MPHWITTPDALASFFTQVPDRIGLDTEFVRERTYWPQLALVQIAVNGEILLVDPLAPGMPAALAPILANTAILKIMHSASEDMVAFKHTCGVVPTPLFDTQIAAALAGVGGGMSYQRLVESITGDNLPKGETRSDWLRRPLSDSQLKYAADDVLHLFELHDVLGAQLQAAGRLAWLQEDCARFVTNAAADDGDPWPHLSMRSAQFLDGAAQVRLLRLLRWRDALARSSDKPRSWILDNELAANLARNVPDDAPALQQVLDTHPKAPRKLSGALWQALQTPLDDESQAPVARAASDRDKTLLKRMQEVVATRTAELGLPDGVLASRKLLEQLLESGQWPPALSGWRHAELAPLLKPLLTKANEASP
ncbi:ribonuclease D [Pseudoxanthomonas dokdonensis]|uniref:Ribonuclease D n=1 Tax=Pseudoxanthomonas dokdonensis TaxID=344882 RepID=A0A0R0CLL3_9GAMM|nr:ribonuclease D [Pseudoxanthomonas dokdonensis]KRG70909.1 ribonuclease D [Pseudoxanthomonas dokdonensis]